MTYRTLSKGLCRGTRRNTGTKLAEAPHMNWTGSGLPSLILVFLLGACGGNAGNSGRTPGGHEAGAAGLAATSGTGGSRDGSGGTGGKMDADSGGSIAAGGRAVTTGGASSGGRNAGPTGGTLVDGGSEGEPTGGRTTSNSAGAPSGGIDTTGNAGAPSARSGGTAGEEGAAGSGTGSGLEGLAFDIQIPPRDNGSTWCQGGCDPATAWVNGGTATSLELVWGSTGRALPVTLTRNGAGWELGDALLLGSYRGDHTLCANESKLVAATFDFDDHDDDGAIDLVVTGHQVSQECSDDYGTTDESDVVLRGVLDTRSPRLIGPTNPVAPVHGISLNLDKPLVQSATCALVPEGGGTPEDLHPRVMNGYVVGFDTDAVLPLGASYTAQVVGEDLAGIGTPPSIEVATLEDFGVLVQDGFESGSTSGIMNAEIVDSFGVPSIEGDRMLRVAPGAGALLHLRRTGGETQLVMDVRKTNECAFGPQDGALEISAAVIGSAAVPSEALTLGDAPTDVTVDGSAMQVGELGTVSWTLPSGDDVLVYLRGDYYYGAGCLLVGALVDNVRLR
jgi:hypothetical protein